MEREQSKEQRWLPGWAWRGASIGRWLPMPRPGMWRAWAWWVIGWVAAAGVQAQPVLQMQVGYRQLGTVVYLPSPTGQLLATADHTGAVKILETRGGRLLCTLSPPRAVTPAGGGVQRMAWSADGLELATPGPEGQLTIWDMRRCGSYRTVSAASITGNRADAGPGADDLFGMQTLPGNQALIHGRRGLRIVKLFPGSAGLASGSDGVEPPRWVTPQALDERLQAWRLKVLLVSGNGRTAILGDDCKPEYMLDLASAKATAISWPSMAEPVGIDPNVKALLGSKCLVYAFSADASRAAFKHRYEDRVTVFNTVTGAVVASQPLGAVDNPYLQPMPAMVKERESRDADVISLGFSADASRLHVLRATRWPRSDASLETRVVSTLKLETEQALPPGAGLAARYTAPMIAISQESAAPALLMPRFASQGLELVSVYPTDTTRPPVVWSLDSAAPVGSIAWVGSDLYVQRTRERPLDWQTAMARAQRREPPALQGGVAASEAPYESQVEKWSPAEAGVTSKFAVPVALPPVNSSAHLAFSADGKVVAVLSSQMKVAAGTNRARIETQLVVKRVDSSDTLWTRAFSDMTLNGVGLSADGTSVGVVAAAQGQKPRLLLLDGRSGSERAQVELDAAFGLGNAHIQFHASGDGVVVGGFYKWVALSGVSTGAVKRVWTADRTMQGWGVSPMSGRVIAPDLPDRELSGSGPAYFGVHVPTIRLPLPSRPGVASVDSQERLVAVALDDRRVRVFALGSGRPRLLGEVQGLDAEVVSLAFSPSGDRLAVADANGVVWVCTTDPVRARARLYGFSRESWAVVDAEGRFDTNNIEGLGRLHWVLPDDPLHALPLEVFMREYFAPGLLARLWEPQQPPVRPLSTLNRAQPKVRILEVTPSSRDPRRVDVTVEVQATKDARGQSGGVSDVRLFRDGSLVGRMEPTLQVPTQRGTLMFRDVRLPTRSAAVSFSAYVFNADGIKSETVRSEYQQATPVAAAGAKVGKAYIVSIGINAADNPAFDLRFAVNDARLMIGSLGRQLVAQGQFSEVIGVPLLADGTSSRHASKAHIRAVLRALAGSVDDRVVLAGVPQAARLAAATPDDVVIVTFAGHGHVDEAGTFFLFPQDVGGGSSRQLAPQTLNATAISTRELELWMRDIDAGEMALIIDACHSAASVEGAGFKPGPLGAPGLGQLAYDKGMRILAASQANEVAAEKSALKHGLLTYALLQNGLANAQADFNPADKRISLGELLAYGEIGVPVLDEELARGKRAAEQATRALMSFSATGEVRVQRPRLFNFARRGEGPLLSVLR